MTVLLMLLFALYAVSGWIAVLVTFGYLLGALARTRPVDLMRDEGPRAVRLLFPTPAYLRLDRIATLCLVLFDLWVVSLILLLGQDGVFTEDWMGDARMMDTTAASYQDDAVHGLLTVMWWTCGFTLLFRWWTAAVAQLCVLSAAAWWVGSFETWWSG
ncbi:hypothetical protein ACFW5I_17260 [Streptomyces sp. NPDC058818]|uniref:hypothetical protein n=1 Tax=Streptomyces sp. NPDC058818 TaxID=3346640 RepID=UPI00369112B4